MCPEGWQDGKLESNIYNMGEDMAYQERECCEHQKKIQLSQTLARATQCSGQTFKETRTRDTNSRTYDNDP